MSDAAGDSDYGLALETRKLQNLFHVQEIVIGETGNIDEEPIIDDDVYNETVRLVTQEEENQEKLSFVDSDTQSCVVRPRKSHITQVCYLRIPKSRQFLPLVS